MQNQQKRLNRPLFILIEIRLNSLYSIHIKRRKQDEKKTVQFQWRIQDLTWGGGVLYYYYMCLYLVTVF